MKTRQQKWGEAYFTSNFQNKTACSYTKRIKRKKQAMNSLKQLINI